MDCGKPVPPGTVRHRDCYEESAQASRSAGNASGRYSILGLSQDILDVLALCREGGAGPIGPGFERMYWTGAEWTTTKPERPSVDTSMPHGTMLASNQLAHPSGGSPTKSGGGTTGQP